jgi:putative effector of murein hydrolase LrgA (UPF0299 family)
VDEPAGAGGDHWNGHPAGRARDPGQHRAVTRGDTAKGLLAHLALLLVPAGAGIVLHLARLREEWLAISAALLVSTVLTLAATAVTFRFVSRLLDREPGDEGAR